MTLALSAGRRSLLTAAAALMLGRGALAQAWPTRPIHIIVPFPAGGPTDLTARVVGEKMSQALGQPVVVENRPGAAGTIGMTAVARAAPDGYTIGLVNTGVMTLAPLSVPDVQWDPIKSFAPITNLVDIPWILGVGTTVPATNYRELLELLKAQPGKFNYGSDGEGTSTHYGFEWFKSLHGLNVVHVPYKGSSAVMADIVANHIQMSLTGAGAALPMAQANRIRAIAVTSANRLPSLPQVPTMVELGNKDFVLTSWSGLAAPAGTPDVIVQRLRQVAVAALQAPDLRKTLSEAGMEPSPTTSAEFATLVKSTYERWKLIAATLRPAVK